MTYGQLFMALNPNVKVVDNGTCVWLFFDDVNHDTFRTEWWNKEIPDEELKAQEPRKKGYWKYPQSLDCCCSECGNQPDHEPGESVPLYDYCPYCGAEMAVKWNKWNK